MDFRQSSILTFPNIVGVILFLALSSPGKSYGVTVATDLPHFQAQVKQHYQTLSPHHELINQQFHRNRLTVHQILQQLEQHQLPKSFVLIPMIESTFNPAAVSPANAAGLWQLMPATAKRFGLTVTEQEDERFDIKRSTEAAITYLSFLYKKFNRDIMLTLAAYNAGEGRVQRALKQPERKYFPSLRLPSETIDYVHKFYALSDLVDIASLNHGMPLLPGANAFVHTANNELPPLDFHQKVLLAELFETRKIIDMNPVNPLISL